MEVVSSEHSHSHTELLSLLGRIFRITPTCSLSHNSPLTLPRLMKTRSLRNTFTNYFLIVNQLCLREKQFPDNSWQRFFLPTMTILLLGAFFSPSIYAQTPRTDHDADKSGNVISEKRQIQDGETVQGNIATPGAQQSWIFIASRGEVLSVRIVSTAKGKTFIPEAKIYDPIGKKISPERCFTSLELPIANTGTYPQREMEL